MEAKTLLWSQSSSAPLLEQFMFKDDAADTLIVGTGHFKTGQRMPAEGCSTYGMREISVILEGAIETTVGDHKVVLRAGDIVTIPANSLQFSHFLEDTKLVYIFFGPRKLAD
ncbi:cupin domain-containing protein [Sphingomonas crocodyli]|uniref:cupin domain-containing protein n=1 Tax=Sphingomonas crocodyli TaxID=1979270 RepID=UPI001F0BFE37|nr:cupin domain-containing protein [Sphingomonas crocodyli]